MKFETKVMHASEKPDSQTGAIVTPLYLTSTFAFEDVGKTRGYDYSRTSNPTRKVLEETIASLEGGKAGFAFATGMAATSTVMHLLNAGDHVISGDDIYGGTYRLFSEVMPKFGIDFSFVRLNDRQKLKDSIRPNTKMIWIETPSNPLLNITDVEMVVDVVKKHNILTAADNTFPTPYFMRPIELGVDIVVHSTTKYLNGHCDVVSGAVVTATDELSEKMQYMLNALGTCASPFDCWLVLRGIKTLHVRVKRHEENAMQTAMFLQGHPKVSWVSYPGLKSHPGHDIASRQMSGFGGMVSFEVKGDVREFLRKVELFSLAESLGGVDSLVEHPATMSHASMPQEFREKVGISDNLVRLSIGLENAQDIIDALDQAL